MAKHLVLKGATSRSEYIFIQDSSVTTGAGRTGLAFNTASLVAYYVRPLGSATAITLATQTVGGAFSSGGFVEVDATNMPGVYRFDQPDAIFATGVDKAVVMLKGAATMAPVTLEYQLVGFDPAALTWLTPTVAGRTLDVTATGAAGIDWANVENPTTALNLSATNIDVDQIVASVSGAVGSVTGAVGSVTGAVGSVTGAVGSVTGNVGGNVVGSVGSVAGSVVGNVGGSVGSVTGAVGSVTGNVGGNVVGSVASVTAAVAITSNIKINQALAGFEFLMTDSTTHAPQTGLVVTVTRSINGGAFAAGTLSAVTEISNGIYSVDFGAGDLNGKVITLQATAALADVTFERIVTQA